MAKKIRYNHSDAPGDWTIAGSGSALYELLMERSNPENQKTQDRVRELSQTIQKSYLEAEAEFRKYWPSELIEKYYGRK